MECETITFAVDGSSRKAYCTVCPDIARCQTIRTYENYSKNMYLLTLRLLNVKRR